MEDLHHEEVCRCGHEAVSHEDMLSTAGFIINFAGDCEDCACLAFERV